jgi:hypothetical protein
MGFFIASINSYYNIMAAKAGGVNDYTFTESDCFNHYFTMADLLLKIDEEDPIIYNLSELNHEACCDAEHTVTESGYSYCSSLDGFQEYAQENGIDVAATLRLSN